MIRKASESLPGTPGLSRRGLLKAGLGVAGVGLVMPSTAAYAAAVAANDLIVTNYRLSPPGWRRRNYGTRSFDSRQLALSGAISVRLPVAALLRATCLPSRVEVLRG